jgi:mono/diheme cytochrome c family protein
MKTSLIALSAVGFLITGQAFAADAAKGKANFEANCAVCHNADSEERKMGPGLKGLFKHDKLANGKAVNEANVTGMINEGGNGMPPFADLLTKAEKDDIVAFLKSL